MFFYDNTKMIFLIDTYAIAKTAGAQLRMIREDIINNAENLVTSSYKMECLYLY